MKDDTRIIEIDGKKYAVERTFDGSPAIYKSKAIVSPVHIDEYKSKSVRDYPSPVPDECIVILARPVQNQEELNEEN